MTNAPRATLLVGLSPIYANGIESILKESRAFHVVGSVFNPREANVSLKPELCILDAGYSSSKPISDLDKLKGLFPDTHCVLLDGDVMRPAVDILRCFKHGAEAYLIQPSTKRLLETLELVLEGQVVLPRSVFDKIPERRPPPLPPPSEDPLRHMLSRREVEVLRRLVDGESNKMIGRYLCCSEATVKVHVKAILRKLRLRNRTMAALWGAHHLDSVNGAMLLLPPADQPIVLEE